MIPLQVLCHELQSDNIYDGIKSIQNMIGAKNFSNDTSEEDINDWATGANEYSLDFSDEEIIQHAKRKESPVLLTEMDAKTKISNAEIIFIQFLFNGLRRIILEMHDILLLKRIQYKSQINHLNDKVSQHKIT